MSAQTEHPATEYLGRNFTSGLLVQWIKEEHTRDPIDHCDVQKLIELYESVQMHNVVRLIQRIEAELAQGMQLLEIGSGTIGLGQTLPEEVTVEAITNLSELYIGIPRLHITPINWLAYLSRRIYDIPGPVRKTIDIVVGEVSSPLKYPAGPRVNLKNLN